jgi:SAM-dependent methyltransferase
MEVARRVTKGHVPPEGREFLYRSGHETAQHLSSLGVFRQGHRILEIGCGNGRIAMGLVDEEIHYVGVDVVPECIAFCREVFRPWAERFLFLHLDIRNAYFYPDGRLNPAELTLPFPDGSFDAVICASLFTHLETLSACERYVREVTRLLIAGGIFYTSWFRFPPNELSSSAARTVLPEADILSLVRGFELVHAAGGETAERDDQWEMVLRKASSLS